MRFTIREDNSYVAHGYPFMFESEEAFPNMEEVIAWCIEQFGETAEYVRWNEPRRNRHWTWGSNGHLWFHRQVDAAVFRLRWC